MGRKVVGRRAQCAQEFLDGLNSKAVCGPDRERPPVPDESAMQEDKVVTTEDVEFQDDEDDVEPVVDEEVVAVDCAMEEDDDDENGDGMRTVWNPRVHGSLKEGEVLEFDSTAYTVYHSLRVEWPCLTFDHIRDTLGAVRVRPPHTLTIASGTQAANASDNKVCLWRVSNLCTTKHDDDSDDESDDDDGDEADGKVGDQPVIVDREFAHPGSVNRLRSCPHVPAVLATWADTGRVHIWDAKHHVAALERSSPNAVFDLKPMFTFAGHSAEGFAVDWSPVVAGRLATGDCNRGIHVWEPHESTWNVSSSAYKGHARSVEDIQWSPSEQGVFASCSVDRSIRIWDTRTQQKSMLAVNDAHAGDVNVISWNGTVPHLMASGSDDGSFKVWDLRAFKSGRAAGFFQWHDKPITAIQWHPTQDSVLGVTSEDDSCTIWDMSVELDREEMALRPGAGGADLGGVDIPPQLIFVHRGQTQIKDLRFHPQIPSLIATTAYDGFNFFKPDNLDAA
ncbi:unnamed protein product (mitochondrion) [Plasmodiophora brassicae]|uniref:Glutamate-rich WD repeat-containing protein 1 n=1 Tax=Plasmodiophora brassicae TaxID=37360 RepID=A0A3P3YN92_PLABS|nr:unnamed protein product [Plasmodiophora brassicae]